MADAIFNEAKDKMHKAAENLQRNLGQIRAGRANVSLLDRVQVTYYGVPTPLNQMASITILLLFLIFIDCITTNITNSNFRLFCFFFHVFG